jgi:hypothetical protein
VSVTAPVPTRRKKFGHCSDLKIAAVIMPEL